MMNNKFVFDTRNNYKRSAVGFLPTILLDISNCVRTADAIQQDVVSTCFKYENYKITDMDNKEISLDNKFVFDIRNIITTSRTAAIRSVDFERVLMYWKLGERIFVEEQQGEERAEYGSYLIRNLADTIEPEFGSGFSYRQLARARQFYRTYPIVSALRTQFNWMQYRLLIQINDSDKREYYECEALNNGWTGRELERQINSGLYERLLLSNDKQSVLEVARRNRIPENPAEIIKDPMILEFFGLKRDSSYYEKDLENALISNLQDFLLELGNGFSFVARQKRILLEDDEFFADLVFYNRLLHCFVIIEIKTHKLTHEDIGQLQMYVNYYDRKEKLPEENPTISILLCADKNDAVVKYTLPEDNTAIMASKYQLYLPSEKQLLSELKRELNNVKL
jgi:predicted nuclease of restriction endonuclease-like (RecB) superfamily